MLYALQFWRRRVCAELPSASWNMHHTHRSNYLQGPPLSVPNPQPLSSLPQHHRPSLPFPHDLNPPSANFHPLHRLPRRPIPPDLASSPHVSLDRQRRDPLRLRHVRHFHEHDLCVDEVCDGEEAGVECVAYTMVPVTLGFLFGVGIGYGLQGGWCWWWQRRDQGCPGLPRPHAARCTALVPTWRNVGWVRDEDVPLPVWYGISSENIGLRELYLGSAKWGEMAGADVGMEVVVC